MAINPGIPAGFSSTVRQDQFVRTIPVSGASIIVPTMQSLKPYGTGSTGTWTYPPYLDGYSASYDGYDDAVTYNFGTTSVGDFTVIFQAKWPSYASNEIAMCVCHNAASDSSGLEVRRSSGYLYFWPSGSYEPSRFTIPDTWKTFSIVQSGSTRSIYVNGVFGESDTNSPTNGYGNNITFGSSRLDSTKMPGEYRNMVVYMSALSDVDRNLVEAWVAT